MASYAIANVAVLRVINTMISSYKCSMLCGHAFYPPNLLERLNLSYNFGVDDNCNKCCVDPGWLASIYMEEADKPDLLSRMSCTECMS